MNKSVNIIFSSLLISTLAVSSVVMAEQPAKAAKQVEKVGAAASHKAPSADVQKKAHDYLVKKVNKDVKEAMGKVFGATQMIQAGKLKEAIVALKDASKKFDDALAKDPQLDLAPIASDMEIFEISASAADVNGQVAKALKALSQGKVQLAREILLPLRDDMEILTVYLPMKTYPDVIKKVNKMLLDADKDGAVAALNTAFTTIVEERAIIPLPLFRAESMVMTASTLDKDKNKKPVLELLNHANEQLQLATALGYTSEASDLYMDLSKQIRELIDQLQGGNSVERFYKKLKTSFSGLIHKHLANKNSKNAKLPKQPKTKDATK